MESTITPQETKDAKTPVLAIISGIVIILAIVGIFFLKSMDPDFCFTFAHNTQFGDKAEMKDSEMSNEPFYGDNGAPYYIPEVPALQAALMEEGYYIDPYENTGGGVYLSAFFGPTTKSAVQEFQREHGLEVTGEVGNDMIDLLNDSYSCPPLQAPQTASSTMATTSVSTSTR